MARMAKEVREKDGLAGLSDWLETKRGRWTATLTVNDSGETTGMRITFSDGSMLVVAH